MKLQAIILDNKIFIPCTCTFDEGVWLQGSCSYQIDGYVTPDLTYFIHTNNDIDKDKEYIPFELNEESPFHDFQFTDLAIGKLELPYSYYSKLPYFQDLQRRIKNDNN